MNWKLNSAVCIALYGVRLWSWYKTFTMSTNKITGMLSCNQYGKKGPPFFIPDYWHSKKLNPNIIMTILSTPATFRSWKKITIHNSLWHFVHCFSIYEMINILQRGFQNILQLTSKHISWLNDELSELMPTNLKANFK